MQVHIDIKGDEAIIKKLEDEKKIKNPLAKFLEISQKIVTNKAKEYTPVETGFLRASWSGHINTSSKPMTAVVTNRVKYAMPLETSGYSPLRSGRIPFLKPAIEYYLLVKEKYFQNLGRQIESEYEK
jgi:hypothetical protein|tara:strand:+ start:178 stop:558 length:381 start_codon:yes stop_codon:yes gene_type:complete